MSLALGSWRLLRRRALIVSGSGYVSGVDQATACSRNGGVFMV